MKMYKVHDSMRARLDAIVSSLQERVDLQDEFDLLPFDVARKLESKLEEALSAQAIAMYKEVDGRTIKFLSTFIRDNENAAAAFTV